MFSDWEEVSTQDHELNYLLRKFNFEESKDNRQKLTDIIDNFKSDNDYSPHQHKQLYKYLTDKKIVK